MKINKRNLLISAFLLIGLVMGAKCVYTDLWGVQGLGAGIFYNKDIARVDKDGNFRLYNGNIVLGDNGTAPTVTQLSTTAGGVVSSVNGYAGIKEPIYYTNAVVMGQVVCSSGTGTAYGRPCTTSGATTVLGIADGTYAAGTVGYMTISGYTLALTTVAVTIGDLLVSTSASSGYVSTNNSASVGTVIGKALSTGVAGGGLTLVEVAQE